MTGARSLAAGFGIGVAVACGGGSYTCTDHAQCSDGELAGTCEPTGYCSFPDPSCESERRYGAHAGELANTCVPLEDGDTGSETSMTSVGPDSIGDGTSDGESAGTLPQGDTSAAETTATSADASTSASGSTEETGTTTAPTCMSFTDDFERPDAADVGNGWIEKSPGVFQLQGGRVADETGGRGAAPYQNNLVRRPVEETVLDVDMSIEVRFSMPSPPGHPQLHARVQPDEVDIQGTLHSYVIFVEDDNGIAIAIARVEPDAAFGNYAETLLPEPLDAGADYRLSARVEGTDPVTVAGALARWDGGEWQVVAEVVLVDADPERITAPGMVGFSGHDQTYAYTYDQFAMNELGCE